MAVRVRSDIDAAIVKWITDELNLSGKVFWDKSSAQVGSTSDRPPLPYVALDISGPRSITLKDTRKTANLDEYELSIVKEITLSITYIGNDDYLEKMSQLADSLEDEVVTQQLRDDAGLGKMDVMPIVDVSSLITTKFELRAQMDVIFSYISTRLSTPGEIHSLEAQGTYNGDPGEIIEVDINS